MTTQYQLTKFREAYSGTKVMVYDDSLVYTVASLYARRAAARANTLIETLELDLIAEEVEPFGDTFIVKEKNNHYETRKN